MDTELRKRLTSEVGKALANAQELWSIPANTRQIQQKLSEPDTPIESVSADIERDPGLAAQCLRVVNSARNSVGGGVTSIKRAVAMLGYKTTHRIVTLAALITRLGKPQMDKRVNLRDFWMHSLWVAHAGSLVARATRSGPPDDFFSAGLMHDIGKLVTYRYLVAHLPKVLDAVEGGSGYEDAERRYFGADHTIIGACVCERWGFPFSLVEAVRHHKDPPEHMNDLELSGEARVVAALCSVERRESSEAKPEIGTALPGIDEPRFEEIRSEATEQTLASLKGLLGS